METTYGNKLTTLQKNNIKIIVDKLIAKGITNKFAQAGILAVVSKESNYNPAATETSYATTKNERIRAIFRKTRTLSEAALTALKQNKKSFFDFIYDGIIGNGPTDGFLFRGRGYNQLTGRANYANISKLIGVDLVKNPHLMENPSIAADALIAYFAHRLKIIYPKVDVNNFKNFNDSLNVYYDANAGSPGKHLKDVTGGYLKAKNVVEDLYNIVNNNKTATGGGFFFLIVTILAVANRKKIANYFNQQKA